MYCAVASENIRYLLELVDRAFGLYSRDAVVLAPVDVGIQTRAAQATGAELPAGVRRPIAKRSAAHSARTRDRAGISGNGRQSVRAYAGS